MNKQEYQELEMEIIAFESEDIITSSPGEEEAEGEGF